MRQAAGRRILRLSRAQEDRVERAAAGDASAAVEFHSALDSDPVRLDVEVISVKMVPAGSGVSYGHTYVTPAETALARIAIGYGHGLPRKAGNRARVTWSAASEPVSTFPIVGRVAMDEFVIDVGRAPVGEGEMVTVFGRHSDDAITLSAWADLIGETPVSVVSCFDERVAREVS